MRNAPSTLVDLNEVLKFSSDPEEILFSLYLPGFLRDRLAMSGTLVGLFWPEEAGRDLWWDCKHAYKNPITEFLQKHGAPVFPIICLENRTDPAPLWDVRGIFELALWKARYFTGRHTPCEFAFEAGIKEIMFFPSNIEWAGK